jgi:F420-non-reducing hydrogenase small subunit
MSQRPKIALYWCSSCGGCEESVLDLSDGLLGLSDTLDIVFWPVAMDAKVRDVDSLHEGELSACLINGSVRTDEQVHMAKLLRAKSKVLIAHGSCACFGGVYALANLYPRDEVLSRSFREVSTVRNPGNILPANPFSGYADEVPLGDFHDRVKTMDQVVDVDYYLPGCPPTPELVEKALMMIVKSDLPPKGMVLADTKALCHSCPRRDTKPERLEFMRFKRLFETEWDPSICFLDQALVCLGPATRGGCGARCINGNMPCRGCFGPTGNVRDHGARSLSFLASMVGNKDEEAMEKLAASIPDPAGLFYRYSVATSILKATMGDTRKDE